MIKVAGLLLAAGASTRMGSPKQLLRAGDTTLLNLILGEALRSDLDPVVLVLGHEAARIGKSLSMPTHAEKLKIVENPSYAQGMSTSIIAGLRAVEKSHDHVMILLADMPRIRARLINHLLKHYEEARLPLAAVSVKGRRSHPVIINSRFYGDLHALKGNKGARDLFVEHADQVCLVEPGEEYNDLDIDTPEDYRRLMESGK